MREAELDTRIAALREGLAGSPYSLPTGELARSRAAVILRRCQDIDDRYRLASQEFALVATELQKELNDTFVVREIHESNALELSPLKLRETKEAIDSAIASGDLAQHATERALEADDHLLEVLGLHRAREFARELVGSYRSGEVWIRESDIRSLHSLVVGHEPFAGSYRSVDVEISGAVHKPRSVVEVQNDMHQLVHWFNSDPALSPALVASVVHSWLAHIHPFEDGNGRMARLLATIALLRANWPPLVIRRADRLEYLDALARSDEGGDILPVFDLVVRSTRATLRHLEDPFLATRLMNEELTGNSDKRYQVWLDLFNQFVQSLRAELFDLGVEVKLLEIPSARSLVQLEERDSSANFWLLMAQDATGDCDVLVWAGFNTDALRDQMTIEAPSFFFGVRDDRPDAEYTYYSDYRGGIIDIDEIALIPRVADRPAFVRRRDQVDDLTIEDAAKLLAAAIAESSPISETNEQ